jgi:hypothetical protein
MSTSAKGRLLRACARKSREKVLERREWKKNVYELILVQSEIVGSQKANPCLNSCALITEMCTLQRIYMHVNHEYSLAGKIRGAMKERVKPSWFYPLHSIGWYRRCHYWVSCTLFLYEGETCVRFIQTIPKSFNVITNTKVCALMDTTCKALLIHSHQ